MIDTSWREEYLQMMGAGLSDREIYLLKNGPDNMSSAWRLQAMRNKWQRLKNHKSNQ